MNACFIGTKDPRWTEFLEQVPHDFYHLPTYLDLSARCEGGEPLAFYAEDGPRRMLAPLLKNRLPQDLGANDRWYDATTPYGYACPLVTPACDPACLERFLRAFAELGRRHGLVSAFFRLHPLFPLPSDALASVGRLVMHGQTVYLDLSLSREELWRQTRSRYRTDFHKLERLGFVPVMDDWTRYGRFVSIYTETMHRLGAGDFYFFNDDYFRGCREVADGALHLCSVLAPGGEVAAAATFTAVGGIVQYHLSGTADQFCRFAPNKLMLDFVRWWAKDRGFRWFHLGGGFGGVKESLFHFKAGFSKLAADFHTYRLVLDAEKYEHLTGKRRQQGRPAEPPPDFFPEYRGVARAA